MLAPGGLSECVDYSKYEDFGDDWCLDEGREFFLCLLAWAFQSIHVDLVCEYM